MARSYAPFGPNSEERIRQPHGHVSSVTVSPSSKHGVAEFDLPFDSCTVTADESWSVHYQVTMTGPAPTSSSRLKALDVVAPAMLLIDAGYVWDDGTEEVHRLATVLLRTITYKDGVYTLTASSAEVMADDYKWTYPTPAGQISYFTLGQWLSETLQPTWPVDRGVVPLDPNMGLIPSGGALTGISREIGRGVLPEIVDVAGRAGVWIYVDRNGNWHIDPKPGEFTNDDQLALTLGRGAGGVATSISEFRNREEWFNYVIHEYWWKNGETDVVTRAYAKSTNPDYNDDVSIRLRVYHERINAGVTRDAADLAVREKLRNLLSRSTAFEVTSIAAYWVTPGRFVEVARESGPVSIENVRKVTFNLTSHEMTIATRGQNIPMSDIENKYY